MLKFEFGKFTEVTELALQVNKNYVTEGYSRIFLCSDVHDTWLVRVLPNTNISFEEDSSVILLERNNVPKEYKGQPLTLEIAESILSDDTFENYDASEHHNIDDIIDILDEGFGINNIQVNTN